MPNLTVYNSKGKEAGTIAIDDDFAKKRVNTRVIYQVVNKYLATLHRGTHKAKKQGEVRGGGKKPWRQKGTGRARAGSIRSPLWRHGGIIFGPVVRGYSYSIPHKTKRIALVEAVKSKIQDDKFIVFDKITLEKPKTKNMTSIINSLGIKRKCLMVMETVENNVKLASRNIPRFCVKSRKDINALDVMRHEQLAMSEESLRNLIPFAPKE